MFGLVGFVWVIAWHLWYRDDPAQHPRVNAAELDIIVKDRPAETAHPGGWPFWRNLLQQRNVRLLCLLYMPNCATFYFCITWLPSYLQNQHGFEKARAGLGRVAAACSPASPRNSSADTSRTCSRVAMASPSGGARPVSSATHCAAVFILLASVATDPVMAAVYIALAASTCMLTTAPAWSTCVDIGRENSGTVSATMNTSGQIAAILSQPIVGYSLDWFHNWNVPFWLLAGLFVMGAICWAFVEPRKPILATTGVDAQPSAA